METVIGVIVDPGATTDFGSAVKIQVGARFIFLPWDDAAAWMRVPVAIGREVEFEFDAEDSLAADFRPKE